jgi:hypothetical protein
MASWCREAFRVDSWTRIGYPYCMPANIVLVPYSARFAEALGVLCTEAPPLAMCIAWLDASNEDLQEWVLNHVRLSWAQGIETIDAARNIAERCEEGRPELLSYGEELAARSLAVAPVQLRYGVRKGWTVVDCPDNLRGEDVLALMRSKFAVRDDQSRLHLSNAVSIG